MARKLVSIEEARAELGGVGRTTIYRLIAAGRLAKVNVGSRAFVTGASIDAYVDDLSKIGESA